MKQGESRVQGVLKVGYTWVVPTGDVWGCVGNSHYPLWMCGGTEFASVQFPHQRGQEMDGWAVATQEYPSSSLFSNTFQPMNCQFHYFSWNL